MGACVRKGKSQQDLREQIRSSLLVAIENGRLEEVQRLYRRYMQRRQPPPTLDVDDKLLTLQEVPLSALAYAFRAGQSEIARFLIEEANASLKKLYETYQLINRSPLDIACEYGFLSLVQYFLPIHLQESCKWTQPEISTEGPDDLSLFADSQGRIKVKAVVSVQPAVHKACEHGHLAVVKYLHELYRGKTPPTDCNVHEVDERAGENCALIAARTGNLTMIRYLHEVCTADFNKLNKRSETAIQIALIAAKRRPNGNFGGCIRYLVETVGVDLVYQYEETLLICEDKSLVDYLESRLASRGIVVSKWKIDQENSITRNRPERPVSEKSREFEARFKAVGANFQLRELFQELPSKSEDLSSIPLHSDTSGLVTPL